MMQRVGPDGVIARPRNQANADSEAVLAETMCRALNTDGVARVRTSAVSHIDLEGGAVCTLVAVPPPLALVDLMRMRKDVLATFKDITVRAFGWDTQGFVVCEWSRGIVTGDLVGTDPHPIEGKHESDRFSARHHALEPVGAPAAVPPPAKRPTILRRITGAVSSLFARTKPVPPPPDPMPSPTGSDAKSTSSSRKRAHASMDTESPQSRSHTLPPEWITVLDHGQVMPRDRYRTHKVGGDLYALMKRTVHMAPHLISRGGVHVRVGQAPVEASAVGPRLCACFEITCVVADVVIPALELNAMNIRCVAKWQNHGVVRTELRINCVALCIIPVSCCQHGARPSPPATAVAVAPVALEEHAQPMAIVSPQSAMNDA